MARGKLLLAFSMIIMINLTGAQLFASDYHPDIINKETAVFTSESHGVVYLAESKNSFNELIGHFMSANRQERLRMLLAHQYVRLLNNTSVTVLEVSFWENAAKVKVNDGVYAGMTGWVLLDSVTFH